MLAATGTSGGALGAASVSLGAALGTAGVIPALVGMGLVGAAGVGMRLMALADCGGPINCVSLSGQCCEILITTAGTLCPAAC